MIGDPKSSRYQYGILEPAVDITDSSSTVDGVLILNHCEEYFELGWRLLDGSPTQHITAVFQIEENFLPGSWSINSPFNVNVTTLSHMILEENPLSLTLFKKDQPNPRKFNISQISFSIFTQFISEMIQNGMVVPSKHAPCSFAFYGNAHRGVFYYTPSYIQLRTDKFEGLQIFWNKVHIYYQRLISHLNQSDILPRDPLFPLAQSAQAAHVRVMTQILDFISTLPEPIPLSQSDWLNLFDTTGKLKNPDSFRSLVFSRGICEEIRVDALPFIFGLYPLGSNQDDRCTLMDELTKEFRSFVIHSEIVEKYELSNHKKLTDSFRVINHDVHRTDRFHIAFKQNNCIGLQILSTLLKAYAVYNPPICYLQGMNDIFVPLILTYLTNWDDEGVPHDSSGAIPDYNSFLPLIFWLFDSLLRNVDHLKILQSVTVQCKIIAQEVMDILHRISPLAAIWMYKNQLNELLWLYSEFVLLYKRTFPNIWPLWVQFNCAPDSARWLSYFVAASLILSFDEMADLPDVSITTIMDQFPKIMVKNDPQLIGNVALYLLKNSPLEPEIVRPEPQIRPHFDFFDPEFSI